MECKSFHPEAQYLTSWPTNTLPECLKINYAWPASRFLLEGIPWARLTDCKITKNIFIAAAKNSVV